MATVLGQITHHLVKYRTMIFAPGGSASMNDLAGELLGWDLSVDAYRKDLKRGAGE
ncbi:hypothetical protein J3454_15300 [Erythrobacter sp. NFXS35]|uniref:hypothetical protein n=1 Tax=Erythrobacter sp. NFXS35 TaxID=2818436 RepID=UPI0032DF9644